MGQITGALVGIALVLSAVFVPMAFFGGSTGVIYRQFSVTIVSAMALSVLVALILTPALCATMLKPVTRADSANARLRLVQPRLRRMTPGLLAGVAGGPPLGALSCLRRHRGGAGGPVRAPAHHLPARRGPGRHDGADPAAAGRDHRSARGGRAAGHEHLLNATRRTRWSPSSAARASASAAARPERRHASCGSGPGSGRPTPLAARPIGAGHRRLPGRSGRRRIFASRRPRFRPRHRRGFDMQLEGPQRGRDRGAAGRRATRSLGGARRSRVTARAPNGLDDTPAVEIDIDQQQGGRLGSRSAT